MTATDLALPAFHLFWRPEVMQEAIEGVFAREPGWDVSEIALDRIRHKLGFRGIVQYRAVFRKGSDRKDVWVAASTYADGRASDLAAKLSTAADSLEPPLQKLVAFDARHDMLFQAFPLDRRLPGAMICRDRAKGAKSLPEGTLTPVRHRLGQSATVQLRNGSIVSYVKFRREGDTAPIVARTQRLRDVVPASVGLALPRVVIPEMDTTVTDDVEGTPLDAGSLEGARSLGRVAEALQALHRSNRQDFPNRSPVPRERMVRAIEWLEFVMPAAEPMLRRALCASLPPMGESLIHGDLKPEHVIVGGDGITFIDLDSAGRGRALSDLATLSVRMGSAEQAADLIDHYRGLSPEIDWSHWETELTVANVKLALFHAQHRHENWEQRVRDALAAGDDRAPAGLSSRHHPAPV